MTHLSRRLQDEKESAQSLRDSGEKSERTAGRQAAKGGTGGQCNSRQDRDLQI